MNIGYFECNHCGKKFVSENNYKNHSCEEKERFEYCTKTIDGRRAFIYYKHWQAIKGRQSELTTFISSRYYNSFVTLVEFIEQKMVPSPKKYIEYCEGKTLLPTMWKRGDVYLSYMKVYDKLVDPLEQVSSSIALIKKLASHIDCKPNEVFIYLYGGEVLKLLTTRQLSPYFCQFSNTFKVFLKTLDQNEKINIMATYDQTEVFTTVNNNLELRTNIQNIISALGV